MLTTRSGSQLASSRSQACLRCWLGSICRSLMCSTRSGVEPGVKTGMVTSRRTNALRSTSAA
ncbi:Uncharacterised protein [Mycobacterium tuberculosis]|uniref:Uncharacterized protein n=1 Tax=Mycobacterium tuberculosis TaxID=1773 RepID=A0A916LCE9_MYCTX|nr:Uncharacterised protein [Mycobacterium tuberculosis]COY51026.1 Uncharacterised protein [Mycobacterium tuberculosis]COZ47696.1 Uncharacterised protein [Mycobacterium tuberculosis]